MNSSREIRFRGWDGEDREFHHYRITAKEGWFEHNFGGLVLELSTGLHDKNGREIFEGDILRIWYLCYMDTKDEFLDLVFESAVYWHTGRAAFCFNAPDDDEAQMFLTRSMQVEVIGNRHEHPELLEGA